MPNNNKESVTALENLEILQTLLDTLSNRHKIDQIVKSRDVFTGITDQKKGAMTLSEADGCFGQDGKLLLDAPDKKYEDSVDIDGVRVDFHRAVYLMKQPLQVDHRRFSDRDVCVIEAIAFSLIAERTGAVFDPPPTDEESQEIQNQRNVIIKAVTEQTCEVIRRALSTTSSCFCAPKSFEISKDLAKHIQGCIASEILNLGFPMPQPNGRIKLSSKLDETITVTSQLTQSTGLVKTFKLTINHQGSPSYTHFVKVIPVPFNNLPTQEKFGLYNYKTAQELNNQLVLIRYNSPEDEKIFLDYCKESSTSTCQEGPPKTGSQMLLDTIHAMYWEITDKVGAAQQKKKRSSKRTSQSDSSSDDEWVQKLMQVGNMAEISALRTSLDLQQVGSTSMPTELTPLGQRLLSELKDLVTNAIYEQETLLHRGAYWSEILSKYVPEKKAVEYLCRADSKLSKLRDKSPALLERTVKEIYRLGNDRNMHGFFGEEEQLEEIVPAGFAEDMIKSLDEMLANNKTIKPS